MANSTLIKNIKIKGYKSIQETEIDFQQGLNIIIGKNASGKTNFVEFLNRIINFKVADLSYFEANLVGYNDKMKDFKISIKSDSIFEDGITKTYLEGNFINEEADFKAKRVENYPNSFFSEITNLIYEKYPFFINSKLLQFAIPNSIMFLTYSEPFEIGFSNGTMFPLIFRHNNDEVLEIFYEGKLNEMFNRLITIRSFDHILLGENKELKEMLLNEFDNFIQSFIKELKKYSIIKNIRLSPDLKIRKEKNKLVFSNILFEFYVHNQWWTYERLSDGTKRLFYILEEIYFSSNIIIIEEPEIGIHPHQLHLLMLFLKEEAERKQIFITTHSPQILDVLNQDELNKIIICEMTENGTQLRHLSDKQKNKAKSYMKDEAFLSDYWIHSDLEPQNL